MKGSDLAVEAGMLLDQKAPGQSGPGGPML